MKKFISLVLSASILLGGVPLAFASSEASESTIQTVIQSVGIMKGDEKGDMQLDRTVTRAEYAKMLVSASTYSDSVSGASNSSPFSDVPYTNWAAGYIKMAVKQGWISGYLDGTYRPNNNVTLEEVYSGCLKLLGYTSEDMSGSYPYAQIALAESLDLNEGITATKGSPMTRKDVMYVFYNMLNAKNKEGKIYAETLGYALDADNKIDYMSLVQDKMSGPYVVETDISNIVNTNGKTIYRNGYKVDKDKISIYDVIYYNDSTIWAYANAVTGTYQSATPSASSPTSVIVAGTTYEFETSQAKVDMSELGGFHVGDVVTLLLGRNGKIVKVLSADDYKKTVVGVVASTGTGTYYNSVGNAYTANTITVISTDGVSYVYPCNKSTVDEGDLVSIGFSNSETDVSTLKSNSLTGKVDGYNIGNKQMANDVRILDVIDNTGIKLYASRLQGAVLSSKDVKYYAENSDGQITDIILNNFSGDGYKYGIITKFKENSMDMNPSAEYTYLLNGEKNTIVTNGVVYGATYGPVSLDIQNGGLKNIKALNKISNPDSIDMLGVTKDNQTLLFSDTCQVYLYKNDSYSLISMTELRNNFSKYNITCYYDESTADGGRIRVVTATLV